MSTKNENKLSKILEVKSFISPSNSVSKESLIRIISVLMDRIDTLESKAGVISRDDDWDKDDYGGIAPND